MEEKGNEINLIQIKKEYKELKIEIKKLENEIISGNVNTDNLNLQLCYLFQKQNYYKSLLFNETCPPAPLLPPMKSLCD